MEEKTKKVLMWEGIVSGLVFLFFIILAIIGIISFLYLFAVVFITIILFFLVWAVIIFIIKKKEKKKEVKKERKIIDKEEAREIALNELYNLNILEYENDLLFEGVWNVGVAGNRTPIYVRKFRGLFEGKIVGILVNMINKQTFFKFYDDIKWSEQKVDEDLKEKANLISKEPTEELKMRELREVGPVPGMERIIKEPIKEEAKVEKEEEGGLE